MSEVLIDDMKLDFRGHTEVFYRVYARQTALQARLMRVLWSIHEYDHPLASASDLVQFMLSASKSQFNVPSSAEDDQKGAAVAEAQDLVRQLQETQMILNVLMYQQRERIIMGDKR